MSSPGAVEISRPTIEAAEHELIVSLPAEPVCLDADLTRLSQVFGNLLTNSAKYTRHGGQIRIAAERRGKDVFVSVRDNGIGIPAESLRSIFDMFSQVDRSIERSTGGLGIGLALVKGLVEMHGGTVTAQSAGVGKGSTFTVRLPVLDVPSGRMSEDEPQGGPVVAGRRASHAGCGRQPRLRPFDGHGAQAPWKRSPHGARRHRGGRGRGGIPARGHPDGRGDAAAQRLRGHPPHSRAAVGAVRHHHRTHRLGSRGRPRPVAGSGLRRPPGQAGRPPRSGEALDLVVGEHQWCGSVRASKSI